MNNKQGALLIASSNVSLIVFSLSPDIPLTTDGADIDKNGTPISYKKY